MNRHEILRTTFTSVGGNIKQVIHEQIKLWRMFVPQNVRRCKQFIPQLYELPKEVLQELVDRGEITQADGIVSLYFLTTNTTLSANEVVTLTIG